MKQKQNNAMKALVRVDDSFSVVMCANGYVIEVNGRDATGDWVAVKFVVDTPENLFHFIKEVQESCTQARGY
jgi:hypothetical protein